FDVVADRDAPAGDGRVLEPFAQVRDEELLHRAHGCSIARSMQSNSRSGPGSHSFSSRAGGYGVANPVARHTGASRPQNNPSWMRAANSAPKPSVRGPSCITTARPVLRTESATVSKSSGFSDRRSTTSTLQSCWSARSAALRAVATSDPYVTTVTSAPTR